MHKFLSLYNRTLFLLYLVLLVWAPLPLGSNRAWSWSLLEVWTFTLAALALLGRATFPRRLPAVVHREWLLISLLIVWLAYLGLQMVVLPLPVLEFLAPSNSTLR